MNFGFEKKLFQKHLFINKKKGDAEIKSYAI